MKYLLLIYEAEEIWDNKTDDEKRAVIERHMSLGERMTNDGIEFAGNALQSTATAVSVRKRGGDMQVSDGPFAETKEQLAGFYLVDVETIEQAMEYAALIPHSETGTIEVRPIDDHADLM